MMNRRQFIHSGIASLGLCAGAPSLAKGLGSLANVANTGRAFSDYKTLVCVNLQGGADTTCLFVPTNTSDYQRYQKIRNNLSFDFESLIGLKASNQTLPDVGLPSFMSSTMDLFKAGKLSFVSNVGTLLEPTSVSAARSKPERIPNFIGSHNSQEAMWHAGIADENYATGWGGRILERVDATDALIPANLSLIGNRKFLRGMRTDPFSVSPQNIINADTYVDHQTGEDKFTRDIFNQLTNTSDSLLDRAVTRVLNSGMDNNQVLMQMLQNGPSTAVDYPSGASDPIADIALASLNAQLKRAAQLISIAPELGHKRQVLLVQMGGFDTHDNQRDQFPALMQALGDALAAFQLDLEARGVDDRVVTFTQSEFGRSITINSNGTDHGWGGHHFVMGTPVAGGQVVGALPEYEIGSSDLYQNMLIPQIAVEQYAANLAGWFGLPHSEILEMLPNYARFDNLDFRLFR